MHTVKNVALLAKDEYLQPNGRQQQLCGFAARRLLINVTERTEKQHGQPHSKVNDGSDLSHADAAC